MLEKKMGLGPLDWLDGKSWGRSVRRLGEGTPSDRSSVRPRGLFNVSMPAVLSHDEQTIMTIMAEHAYMDRSMMDPAKANQVGIDHNAGVSAMKWLRSGAQVFDFEAALADELMDTDVDDVPASEVLLPYDCIYIRLRTAAADPSGAPYDGFLVERRQNEETAAIGVTPIMRVGRECRAAVLSTLHCRDGLTVAQALAGEADRLKNPSNRIHFGGMERSVSASAADAMIGANGMDQTDPVSKSMSGMRDGILSIEAVMPFIVNAVLYIDSCRNHIRRGWPTGAPEKIAADVIAA
jgi:hypothetical protein